MDPNPDLSIDRNGYIVIRGRDGLPMVVLRRGRWERAAAQQAAQTLGASFAGIVKNTMNHRLKNRAFNPDYQAPPSGPVINVNEDQRAEIAQLREEIAEFQRRARLEDLAARGAGGPASMSVDPSTPRAPSTVMADANTDNITEEEGGNDDGNDDDDGEDEDDLRRRPPAPDVMQAPGPPPAAAPPPPPPPSPAPERRRRRRVIGRRRQQEPPPAPPPPPPPVDNIIQQDDDDAPSSRVVRRRVGDLPPPPPHPPPPPIVPPPLAFRAEGTNTRPPIRLLFPDRATRFSEERLERSALARQRREERRRATEAQREDVLRQQARDRAIVREQRRRRETGANLNALPPLRDQRMEERRRIGTNRALLV